MTGILAASLTACQGKTSKEETSDNTKVEEGSKAFGDSNDSMLSGTSGNVSATYKQVLDSSLSFKSTDEGGVETYLNQFTYNGATELDSPYDVTRFAYLDLDLDNENEIVLELDCGYDGAYEVLKEIDGTVYGYYFNYRSINQLYTDGTMMGSSGASDSTIYRLLFTASGATESIQSDSQRTRTETTWYDFTSTNIDMVLGGDSQNTTSTTTTMDSFYKQVLDSSLSFKSTDEGGVETYLNQFKYFGANQLDTPYNIARFAYLDLDLDSEKEIVLELDAGYDGAFEILKEIDGTVYGYYFNYRSINPLYADGSMMGSSGAADFEIYRLQFTTTGCTETVLGSSDTTSSTATWYDFTTANIDMVLGGTSQTSSQTTTSGSLLNIDEETVGYVFMDSDTEYLAEDEVKYVPTEILKIARNEIYARHGYQFTSDMKTFFENKEWYSGTVSPSNWSDSKLNTYEKANVQLIKKYENQGAEKPFFASAVAGGTVINEDGFTLTLPSEWTDSNYFAMKRQDSDEKIYSFYSKNNFAYGSGGHVFSLIIYNTPTSEEDLDFCDNLISLGNDGTNYYFMAQSTDVQFAYEIPELSSEWQQLSDTYQEIADSFTLK